MSRLPLTRLPLTALATVFVLAPATVSLAQLPFGLGGYTSPSIEWTESSDEALRSASLNGRPILAYVTSANCTYCRKMDRESWSDAGVAGRVAAGFTPLKIRAEANPDLVQALPVRAFPTTIVLSPEGQGLGVLEGYGPPGRRTEALDALLTPTTDIVAAAN